MLKKIPLELIFWLTAIISLAISDPSLPHYSLCVFRFLGWQHCPGCGLGHAIAYLLRGDIVKSWHSHPLGGFAIIVIFRRMATLSVPYYLYLKKYFYGRKQFLVPAGN